MVLTGRAGTSSSSSGPPSDANSAIRTRHGWMVAGSMWSKSGRGMGSQQRGHDLLRTVVRGTRIRTEEGKKLSSIVNCTWPGSRCSAMGLHRSRVELTRFWRVPEHGSWSKGDSSKLMKKREIYNFYTYNDCTTEYPICQEGISFPFSPRFS